MTLAQPEQMPQFEPEFVKGMVEALIHYMESCGCTGYDFSLCGWKIRMQSSLPSKREFRAIDRAVKEKGT